MTVVQVRQMMMTVLHPGMLVLVRVRPSCMGICAVNMNMVIVIMTVPMFVCFLQVGMTMLMLFAQHHHRPQNHQGQRDQKQKAHWFTEDHK